MSNWKNSTIKYYSVLSAITGSFLLANLAGINPPIIVSVVEIIISIKACTGFNFATLGNSDNLYIIILAGNVSKKAINIPINPDVTPIINVSALNTRDISFFLAQSARNIPISFVLYRTLIYVIIPIIIQDTTSEIDENAIKTSVTASIIDPLIEEISAAWSV